MNDIAIQLGCSIHKVTYWMKKHNIPKRSISEAIYNKNHPHGDPFDFSVPTNPEKLLLYGIGMGLYWGEGTKSNKYSVRLGNTDPELIVTFVQFLTEICNIRKEKLRFGLQIFSDTTPETALNFWLKRLRVDSEQFYKITVTRSGSVGTYKNKSEYGVVTVYFNNKKLRDILVQQLAGVAQSARARQW